MDKLRVKGRVLLEFNIRAVTGLHIGGAGTGIQIGGIDKEVIRDPLTNRPYIPGSSLKGKVRSLLEKQLGLRINRLIGRTKIHSCDNLEEYKNCRVCWVFGVPGEVGFNTPTRLIVRDVPLSEESAQEMERLPLDRPFAEVKTEVSIDRITSAANPRTIERVPAGAIFGPGEMVYTIYSSDDGLCTAQKDVEFLATVFHGLKLLEQDYLGGLGSRGSGKVKFEKILVFLSKDAQIPGEPLRAYDDLDGLLADLDPLLEQIRTKLEGG
ncbi:MAG: type III-A CRISPR-associated RAMP protein Csm3 [Clostridia bacterium]|nr:type III-A CRISPR-associated RAMP protein Csm3 [Clostridia bacterium]